MSAIYNCVSATYNVTILFCITLESRSQSGLIITKTCPRNRDFLSFKNRIFSAEAVLSSTHNLCFGTKKNKQNISISMHTPVLLLYVKLGFDGVYFTRTCYPDGLVSLWLTRLLI